MATLQVKQTLPVEYGQATNAENGYKFTVKRTGGYSALVKAKKDCPMADRERYLLLDVQPSTDLQQEAKRVADAAATLAWVGPRNRNFAILSENWEAIAVTP